VKIPEGLYFHPIFVHFPQALFPVAFASFLLYAATGARDFEAGAFLIAAFGALLTPLTTATGFADWKIRYKGYMTSVFKIKITGSFVLMGLSASAVLLRYSLPGIATFPLSGMGWLYAGLLATCTGTCVVLGHFGGKLVFH
jgi:uncharacterized membrane protein